MQAITQTVQRTGLLGCPLEHSISPAMHNAAFAALGLDAWRYEALPVKPEALGETLAQLRARGFVGLNVTIPHKQSIMPQLATLSDAARCIGAVNTLVWQDGGWHGENTDAPGFLDDLRAHDVDPAGRACLVIGAGGAARAAVYALKNAGAQVSIINRSRETALSLASEMSVEYTLRPPEGVEIIVNATPAGMWPHVDVSPWPKDCTIPAGALVYDMICRPAHTLLMQQAERAGARAIGGLGMLARQGAAAFALWTGQPAPIDVMLESIAKSTAL